MPLILGSNSPTGGYEVDNSLRFNSGSSDYLTSSFTTPTNNKIWTLSYWFKRSEDATQVFLSCHDSVTDNRSLVYLDSGSVLRYQEIESGVANQMDLRTNALLRDFSAWYHLVVAVDTTQATASNRAKIYINGEQVTSFSTETYISQNTDTYTNTSGLDVAIGRNEFNDSTYLGSYLSEYCFIDGQQLDETSFGEFDADTGIWKPIDVSGLTFGTNGFYLPFENSADLGQDDSGNGNDLTVNNLTSIDQTTDTPTNNFVTLNPLIGTGTYTDSQTYSNGNTIVIPDATDTYATAFSTLGVQGSGKWYWEAQIVWNGTSNNANFPRTIGFCTENYLFNYSYLGQDQESWGMIFSDDSPDQWFASHPDENNNEGGTMANGDTVNLALDLDNGYFYFGVNGVYLNSGDPTSGASGTGAVFTLTATDLSKFIIPAVTNATNTTYYKFNFGNPAFTISSGNSDANGYGNFEYAPPSGYYALCTKNLAEYG